MAAGKAKKMARSPNSKAKQAKPAQSSSATEQRPDQNEELALDEVLALGGTQEDYDWLLQAGSAGSASATNNDQSFDASEVQSFWKNLGFDKLKPQDSALPDAVAEAEDEVQDAAMDSDEEDEEDDEGDAEDEQEVGTATRKGDNPEHAALRAGLNQLLAKGLAGADGDDEEEDEEDDEALDLVLKEEEAPAPAVATHLQRDDAMEAKYGSIKLLQPPARKGLIIDGIEAWHAILDKSGADAPDALLQTTSSTTFIPPHILKEILAYAQTIMNMESATAEAREGMKRNSDLSWLKEVMTSGTLADRQAALVTRIQEDPVHHVRELDTLMGMLAKKSRREALSAADSLYEAFTTALLIPNRKLVAADRRPWFQLLERGLGSGKSSGKGVDRIVLLWFFEDLIKRKYLTFVQRLQDLVNDSQLPIRSKILGMIFDLLRTHSEQEKILLTSLVSKLQDAERKLASKAGHFLHLLMQQYPLMKSIVAREVKAVLFKPSTKVRGQYYAMNVLNQIELSRKHDQSLANELLDIYFTFFKERFAKHATGSDDEEDDHSRLLAALLTGINRAYPFGNLDAEKIQFYADDLFRMCHVGSFNCSIQALNLLFQFMDSHQAVSDRFYRTLYATLLDTRLPKSSKKAMYLNLLFRALKNDPMVSRLKAFVKRLMQTAMTMNAAFMSSALVIFAALVKEKPSLRTLLEAEVDDDSDDERLGDRLSDDDTQTVVSSTTAVNGDEGQQEEAEEEEEEEEEEEGPESNAAFPHSNFVAPEQRQTLRRQSGYDPLKREPLYAGAELSSLWELALAQNHFHPTVTAFADKTLRGLKLDYNGDPLQDMTLIKFLDRFVNKQPKKVKDGRNVSIMQPLSALDKQQGQKLIKAEELLQKSLNEVAPEDRFLYHFYQMKGVHGRAKRSKGPMDEFLLDALEPEERDFAAAFGVKGTGEDEEEDEDFDDIDDDDENENDDEEEAEDEFSRAKSMPESAALDLDAYRAAQKEQGADASDDEYLYDYDDLPGLDDDGLVEDPVEGAEDEADDDALEAQMEADLLREFDDDSDLDDDDDAFGDDDDEDDGGAAEGSSGASMFASADEFAQLLEDDDRGQLAQERVQKLREQVLGSRARRGKRPGGGSAGGSGGSAGHGRAKRSANSKASGGGKRAKRGGRK
ncbi:uncharacterized protein MONBRDRAFT_29308 [Monosiga brevicollis MX1]|uniref:CCAAT-binding factor domain-containing protein n=1 Tax=Monosiga brevicollis TaxID=81824 RepID=A9VAQ5_MONBE|nr:uncharacterized protein MONBRDRAFT_29308 [Monosiga brevicollis MX1]EDQ85363.1 predicted protein [Monosiga brevicollis MX1]|eukprot:XP_001749774.1 hypothetical protein [Monosiga brevicollis MX1]